VEKQPVPSQLPWCIFINQVLQTIIAEVKSGQRKQPYKYEDLT
jgi:hypothetical protein